MATVVERENNGLDSLLIVESDVPETRAGSGLVAGSGDPATASGESTARIGPLMSLRAERGNLLASMISDWRIIRMAYPSVLEDCHVDVTVSSQ